MDELGDGGSVASVVESSVMTATVPPSGDESLLESIEGEVEGSYDGEHGDDIMIDSDLFVDGVCSNDEDKEGFEGGVESFENEGMVEGDVGSHQAGDLEGSTETGVEGSRDTPGEKDEISGDVLQKEEVEEEKVEMSDREREEVQALATEQVVGGPESLEEGGALAEEQVVGGSESREEGGGLVKDQVIGVSESVNEGDKAPGKASQDTGVVDHEVWNPGINGGGVSSLSVPEPEGSFEKEKTTSTDENPGSEDNLKASEKDQGSDLQMAGTPSEALDKDNVQYAVLRRHVVSVTTEEIIISDTRNMETNESIPEDTRNVESNECKTVDIRNMENNVDDQFFEASGKAEPMKDDSAVDNSRNCGNSGVEHVEISTEHVSIEDSGVEPETQLSDGKNEASRSEDFPTTKQDGDISAAPDSSTVQSSVVERGEWDEMDLDVVLDFKDDAMVLDASDSVLRSKENVEDLSGKSTVPDCSDAAKPASCATESHASDVGKSVELVRGEGHVQSGSASLKEQASMATQAIEAVAEEKVANIRVEVSEDNRAVGEFEHSNTSDVSEGTEKKTMAEANSLASREPSVAVSPVELSSESEIPISNAIYGSACGPNTNDPAEDGVIGNNPSEVSVGADASILEDDADVVSQIDFQIGDEKDVAVGEESGFPESNGNDEMQVDLPEIKLSGDEKDMTVGSQIDQEKEDVTTGENTSEINQSKAIEGKKTKTLSSVSEGQPGYLLGPADEGEFSITDLVWGKVRSHPWWPGQIFDPADASDKAVKYHKKDTFLVAYFGDRTFAWNDASLLKPFGPFFSQIEKQSSSEAFQNAVSCALDEVSRRVKLGLSCSCISKDAREKIECQTVENTGIREESSRRYGIDKSSGATSFDPNKLLHYVRSLAWSPVSLPDRLELVRAHAQLSSFCCFKGYREPPTFEVRDAMLDKDVQTLKSSDESDQPVSNGDEHLPSPRKRTQSQKDDLHSRKEKSLSELMGDMEYSPEDEDDLDGKASSKSVYLTGKKRKAVDSLTDGSDKRISFYAAKVSTTSSSPKPSFKVGDCIRRVASQLTGSAPGSKGINEQTGMDSTQATGEESQLGFIVDPSEISSLEKILLQLQLAASDPKKAYSFLSNIIVFFSGFRKSVVRKNASVGKSAGGRKRKAEHTAAGAAEEFEFDDVNDSYWTDRIVQNYSEEQLLHLTENGERDHQLVVASDANKARKTGRSTRKRYSNGNYETPKDEKSADFDRKKLELPAELVLTFAEGNSVPSEINLNKIFRRFGAIKESETEVDFDSHRARVVFKRGAEAEAAYTSVGRINIFGSKAVSYELNYSPATDFGSSSPLMLEGTEEAT
ncbi:OLC1v1025913C1 [Oldenlandia corymbosa var. corymbosa]|uniref:OLC1v1025913C1 n=1 Tax=Oldenlandia corymbosa var. corymbosa TaxID=529605 RepID=A0AAV1C5Y9_OLDCO|nr:OLC1v1025913C1 [Oldenlandia corymbosa var. corymbosa]